MIDIFLGVMIIFAFVQLMRGKAWKIESNSFLKEKIEKCTKMVMKVTRVFGKNGKSIRVKKWKAVKKPIQEKISKSTLKIKREIYSLFFIFMKSLLI